MKNDREFLDGMWEKVSQTEQTEYEELQNKAAKKRHKKIMFKDYAITVSIITACALFILSKPEFNYMHYVVISAISLTAAYWLDKFISGENKEKSETEREELYEN